MVEQLAKRVRNWKANVQHANGWNKNWHNCADNSLRNDRLNDLFDFAPSEDSESIL